MRIPIHVTSPHYHDWYGVLTDEHAASSYGIPVLVDHRGIALGNRDLATGTKLQLLKFPLSNPLDRKFAEKFGLPVDD